MHVSMSSALWTPQTGSRSTESLVALAAQGVGVLRELEGLQGAERQAVHRGSAIVWRGSVAAHFPASPPTRLVIRANNNGFARVTRHVPVITSITTPVILLAFSRTDIRQEVRMLHAQMLDGLLLPRWVANRAVDNPARRMYLTILRQSRAALLSSSMPRTGA
jgi:hypothetical protein